MATTHRRTWYPLSPGAPTRAGRAVAAPVDPLTGPQQALAGRVVTMDDGFTVKTDAVIYIESGVIVAIQDRAQPAPAGFADVRVVSTEGTIFPGLIELHNHMCYNALPLWFPVPRRFSNRDQWARLEDYRRLISGPMTVIGRTPTLLPALVRYVEAKCLLGGVTTTQGIRLASNAGVSRYYRGLVRNVEQTDDPDLPEADARIADVAAKDARAFEVRLEKASGRNCLLLHLSEGKDEAARRHFQALEVKPGRWAISDALAGIHAAALTPEDFDVLAANEGSMVWSPLSNLLLYGDTARVDAARAAGVTIGLGSDWSPSGSKNLLGELKVAAVVNDSRGGVFSARDLVAMATRNGAAILKWSKALGSLEAGKRADLLVIAGTSGDPYASLIEALETDIRLVMINGIARYGVSDLMDRLAPRHQTVRVGGESRRLYLRQATSDPDVAHVSLRTATSALRRAFRDIARLARALEKPAPPRASRALDEPEPVVWSLALDELHETGMALRPRLPYGGPRDFTGPRRLSPRAPAAASLSGLLSPIALDPLTVADDGRFLESLGEQPNLPDAVKAGVPDLY
jgi:5-methylthioadenosine/S-adenosylhomocysteine deaminase